MVADDDGGGDDDDGAHAVVVAAAAVHYRRPADRDSHDSDRGLWSVDAGGVDGCDLWTAVAVASNHDNWCPLMWTTGC